MEGTEPFEGLAGLLEHDSLRDKFDDIEASPHLVYRATCHISLRAAAALRHLSFWHEQISESLQSVAVGHVCDVVAHQSLNGLSPGVAGQLSGELVWI